MGSSRTWRTGLVVAVAVVVAAVAAWAVWLWVPAHQIPVPGPDTTPEEVVLAYLDALNGRDRETADAIYPREPLRSLRADDVEITKVLQEGAQTHVLFTADFSGGDGSLEDGLWGYYLERGPDGRWQIVDSGVA